MNTGAILFYALAGTRRYPVPVPYLLNAQP